MVVRGVEVEFDPDEDTGPEAVDLAEVGVGNGLLCYLKHEHLLGKGLFDLPGRDLESTHRNLELLDKPSDGCVRKAPVIHLWEGGMIFATAHQTVADLGNVPPRTDSSPHPDDGYICALRRAWSLCDTHHRPSPARLGRLLQEQVGVGSSESEPADRGPAWVIGRRLPRSRCREHTKRTSIQLDLFPGFLVIGRGWEHTVLHRQHGLQETDGARSREEMAGIRFDRPDHTLAGLVLLLSPKCLEARELDGIPDRGARRVALDHVYLARGPPRGGVGPPHGAQLAFLAGSEETAFNIVGKPHRVYHRADSIALAARVRQALQD